MCLGCLSERSLIGRSPDRRIQWHVGSRHDTHTHGESRCQHSPAFVVLRNVPGQLVARCCGPEVKWVCNIRGTGSGLRPKTGCPVAAAALGTSYALPTSLNSRYKN